ncbi:MAG: hypothetical protein ACK4E0_17250 [Chitinophagaceae bacterium]
MRTVMLFLLLVPICGWSQQSPGTPASKKSVLPPSEPQASLTHSLPNGSKVYALPQDGMPCVVPPKQSQPALARTLPDSPPAIPQMPVQGLRRTPLIPGAPTPYSSLSTPIHRSPVVKQKTRVTIPVPNPSGATSPTMLPDWRKQLPRLQTENE